MDETRLVRFEQLAPRKINENWKYKIGLAMIEFKTVSTQGMHPKIQVGQKNSGKVLTYNYC